MAGDLPDAPWASGSNLPDAPWDAPKPKADTVSQPRAALEGALSGVSANFNDEIYGASKASGLPEILGGFRAPVGAARLAYEKFTEPGEATTAYDKAVAEKRALQKAAQEQHPGTYLTGQVGGALALPMGGALNAATLPARIGRGAAVGAGYGGLSGVGEGEGVSDSLTKGAIGTVAGAGIGAIAPPLVEGAIQGATAAARPLTNALRGAWNPENEAARRITTAIQRDIKADPTAETRLTPQEFISSSQQGTPVAIVDLGGGLTRRLADSAAITSPEGETILKSTVSNRFEGQSPRIVSWLRDTFNYPNAPAQQEAITKTAAAINTPAYSRAMREGAGGVWDKELQRLAGAPAIQEAANSAVPSLANRGITEGFSAPRRNPLVFDRETGIATLKKTPNGNEIVPDLRFWDQTKRNLDGMIAKAERYGDKSKVQELTAVKSELTRKLDELVPSYKQARSGAAHFFGAENALEAGEKFVGSKVGNYEARTALAKMSPVEKQLFQDGYVSKLITTLGEGADRRSALNQIAQSPAARERLQIALGPQRAKELEGLLRVEGIMDMARTAINGNSWTAKRLYDLGLAGGAGLGAHGTYNMDPKEMTFGAILGAISSGGKHIDQRVAMNVAKMLASNDPSVLSRGIKAMAKNNNFLNAIRSTDRNISQAAIQHQPLTAQRLGTMQGTVPAGAEENQQQ